MDNFPDLFNTNDTWGVVGENGRDLYRETSSVDSSTPPPQNLDSEERKNANSIRGTTLSLKTPKKVPSGSKSGQLAGHQKLPQKVIFWIIALILCVTLSN